jgi:hypothetical protein
MARAPSSPGRRSPIQHADRCRCAPHWKNKKVRRAGVGSRLSPSQRFGVRPDARWCGRMLAIPASPVDGSRSRPNRPKPGRLVWRRPGSPALAPSRVSASLPAVERQAASALEERCRLRPRQYNHQRLIVALSVPTTEDPTVDARLRSRRSGRGVGASDPRATRCAGPENPGEAQRSSPALDPGPAPGRPVSSVLAIGGPVALRDPGRA